MIDSQYGILASCRAALRALGDEPDEALDITRIIGPPLEDIMQVLLQPYGDDRIGEAVAAYRRHYGESGFRGSEPFHSGQEYRIFLLQERWCPWPASKNGAKKLINHNFWVGGKWEYH